MRIIKVNATNSTNSFAKDLYRNSFNLQPICVLAREQTAGRGQRGASWISNAGENLTFSVIYPSINVQINDQFLISAAVANSIFEAIVPLNVKNLKIKWPNDIMAANKKIGGILIENFIASGRIGTSIIGVGLNVNQQLFSGLPQAASLSMVTGKEYNLETLLDGLLESLEVFLGGLQYGNSGGLLDKYHERLFKIKKPSTFQLPDATYFVGVIQGVAPSGKLRVQVEGDLIKEFDVKEVKLCY